ncbi:hypothetical protein [Cyanobium sp. A2C-AMD]|uniref:hypothetical protein n=1 Tax=Cyanobium sp. A2C-AMD TaxID=2823695 RepID=UPI0020CF4A9F|nr:hypothetical protein [Cyanobium sp. A2C-AMD]MCP9875600.1 hypothetical protein [Cyanobium sp. A2C-AMD]
MPTLQNQYGAGSRQPIKQLTGLLLNGPGGAQLLVPRPGQTTGHSHYSRILLAGPGKSSPPDSVMQYQGQWVRLQGSLFSHGALSVMNTRQAQPIPQPADLSAPDLEGISLGSFKLVGEIIDSKCFSGVMKPGAGKTHMGCAIRCISGGVPVVFHVHNSAGEVLDLVLIDQEGNPVNDRVLDVVAQAVAIEGEVIEYDNLMALKSDPSTYRLLNG